MPTIDRRRAGLAALLALCAACGETNAFTTPPAADMEMDAVRLLGEQTGALLGLIAQMEEEATLARPDPTAPMVAEREAQAAATCTYSTPNVRWTCTGVATGGQIGGTASFQFRNAAGQARPVYDAGTTASVDILTEVSGTAAQNGYATTVEADAHLTLGNLAGAETFRLWDGDGTTSQAAQMGGSQGRTYLVTSVDSVSGLRFNLPHDANRFPDAGTIVVRLTARITEAGGQSVSGSIGRRFVITFDGDGIATISTGTRTYNLDLATRAVGGG